MDADTFICLLAAYLKARLSSICLASYQYSDRLVSAVIGYHVCTGSDGQDTRSGLPIKQQEVLQKCILSLQLLDPAFLDAAGLDKRPVLVRALEVSSCPQHRLRPAV